MLWRHKVHINPTNSAAGLEIQKSGFWFWKKVTLTASFSNGEKQQETFPKRRLLRDLARLKNDDMVDYDNNLQRIVQNNDEIYLYFKPEKYCDLITVKKQDLVQAIK
jgi:hypothetical protein